MAEQFVCESVKPVKGEKAAAGATRGEPGLPTRFVWRDREYVVARVLEQWKDTGPCRHGSGEKYVRRHWYRILTTGGDEMRIYFDRQARSGRERLKRWWLHSIVPRDD